jgi:hypothetical protein
MYAVDGYTSYRENRTPEPPVEVSDSDRNLVGEVLGACDDTDAAFALALLGDTLPERVLVVLANLRGAVRCLPQPPFLTEQPLSELEQLGYEPTGRSFRKLFEAGHGVFGIEFVGDGRVAEAVVIHTPSSRCRLGTRETEPVDGDVVQVLLNHPKLPLYVTEALELLGKPVETERYESSAEFLERHAAGAAGRLVDELF